MARKVIKTEAAKDYKAVSQAKDDFLKEAEILEAEDLLVCPQDIVHINQVTAVVILLLAEELELKPEEVEKNSSLYSALGDSVYSDDYISNERLAEFFEVTELDDNLAPLTPRQIALQICNELEIDTSPKKAISDSKAEKVTTPERAKS